MVQRPLLYLDFDGVFLVPGRKPNVRCVQVLNSLISTTNCAIVVSSVHRLQHSTLRILNYVVNEYGVNGEVVGRTGNGLRHNARLDMNAREYEIYVDAKQRGVKQWCAIDDSVMNRWRMVRVSDPVSKGFTEYEAEQVYLWLTRGD